jgi:hypothetical protein
MANTPPSVVKSADENDPSTKEFAPAVHVVPSVDVAIEFDVPSPTATHKLFPYATPRPIVSKIPVFPPRAVHVIPSVDDAKEFDVPLPTATHKSFPYATPPPKLPVLKIVFPLPVHAVPSVDDAKEDVPFPIATQFSGKVKLPIVPDATIVFSLPFVESEIPVKRIRKY